MFYHSAMVLPHGSLGVKLFADGNLTTLVSERQRATPKANQTKKCSDLGWEVDSFTRERVGHSRDRHVLVFLSG